jgi:hypothetical protein
MKNKEQSLYRKLSRVAIITTRRDLEEIVEFMHAAGEKQLSARNVCFIITELVKRHKLILVTKDVEVLR